MVPDGLITNVNQDFEKNLEVGKSQPLGMFVISQPQILGCLFRINKKNINIPETEITSALTTSPSTL